MRWVLLALRQIKRVLLANGAAAVGRGQSRWSIFFTVMSPRELKGKKKPPFVHRFINKYKKINNILTQYKCKYCSLVSITNTACLHIENGNSSSFTDGTYGSALVKMLG